LEEPELLWCPSAGGYLVVPMTVAPRRVGLNPGAQMRVEKKRIEAEKADLLARNAPNATGSSLPRGIAV
jgi:hypothetical protein